MPCADCFKGAVHSHTKPKGKFETVFGVRTYIGAATTASEEDNRAPTASFVSASTDIPNASPKESTIIFLSDAFGLKLVNTLLLADLLATKTGCRVLVPDLLRNGGMEPWIMDATTIIMNPVPSWFDLAGIFRKIWTVLTVIPHVIPFLLFGQPVKVLPGFKPWAKAVGKEVEAQGGKVGMTGYCWGAGLGVPYILNEYSVTTRSPVDAIFMAHPSLIKPEQLVELISTTKVPASVAVAEHDQYIDTKTATEIEAQLRGLESKRKGMQYEFGHNPGCRHSFAVRAENDERSMKGYYSAAKQAIDWFNKYLN